MKLSVIIPCYNESDNVSKLHDELLPVVEDLISHGWKDMPEKNISAEMIFVDDGSRDDTTARLKDAFGGETKTGLTFKFLKHETNLGLGAAIRTGFMNAAGEVILTVDSDGTYKFLEIPALLSLLTPDVDIVTASPYHPAGGVVGVPAYRLFLSQGSSLLYRLLLDWNIHTYTCLFRAYRSEVVRNIGFKSNGFLGGTELLVNAIRQGYKVAEFPAVLYKRMYGVSKARILQTIWAHLNFQAWVLFHRMQLRSGINHKHVTQ